MNSSNETVEYLKKFNSKMYEKLKEQGWIESDFPFSNKIIVEKVDIGSKKE